MCLPKYLKSPYNDNVSHYRITEELISNFPKKQVIINSVKAAWETIKNSYIGDIPFMELANGVMISSAMEQLIGRELEKRTDGFWKNQEYTNDKDFPCVDNYYSIECKVSDSVNRIPGNKNSTFKETKISQGFYVIVNYENSLHIRLGWIDDSNWVPSKSEKSGSANIPMSIQNAQLVTIYKGPK